MIRRPDDARAKAADFRDADKLGCALLEFAMDQNRLAANRAIVEHGGVHLPMPNDGPERTGMFPDDVSEDEGEATYEAVTCLACAQMHLVNRSTHRGLGADGD